MPRTVYNLKRQFLLVGFGTITTNSPLNRNVLLKYFDLKINRNIFDSKIFINNAKNANKIKKFRNLTILKI